MSDHRIDPQPNPFTTEPRSRPLRAHSYNLPPTGPMHHMHKRHFAGQEGLGFLIMLTMVGVIVYFVGWDMGIWSALFG